MKLTTLDLKNFQAPKAPKKSRRRLAIGLIAITIAMATTAVVQRDREPKPKLETGDVVRWTLESRENSGFVARNQAGDEIVIDMSIFYGTNLPKAEKHPRFLAATEHVAAMDALGLLTNQTDSLAPVIFDGLPSGLQKLETELKKTAFIGTLLPIILYVNAEILEEQQKLQQVERLLSGPHTFSLEDLTGSSSPLPVHLAYFLFSLAEKYRAPDLETLKRRVQPVPPSLTLAQAAIESGWGASRIAVHGNNLFGMQTQETTGLKPLKWKRTESHYFFAYETLLDSVRHYMLNLNRHAAYKDLRLAREATKTSVKLSDNLLAYSERGKAYTADVKAMIQNNQLQRYDQTKLYSAVESEDLHGAASASTKPSMARR